MNKSFPTRDHYLKAKAEREKITNPPKPTPRPEAVKVLRRAQYAGTQADAGALVPIWPVTPPKGWLSQDEARDLIESGLVEPASPEEIDAFLAANERGEA